MSEGSSTNQKATVLYAYEAASENELSLQPGQVLALVDYSPEEEWWQGTLYGKTGFFPRDFVQLDGQTQATEPPADDGLINPIRGVAIHDYKAEGENELSIVKGEVVYIVDPDFEANDWVAGYTQSDSGQKKQGFLPKAFIDVSPEPAAESAPVWAHTDDHPHTTDSVPVIKLPASAPAEDQPHSSGKHKADKKKRKSSEKPKQAHKDKDKTKHSTTEITAATPKKFAKSTYEFTAETDNELSLSPGDIITLIDFPETEDWWLGTKGDKRGFFPKQYVEFVAAADESSARKVVAESAVVQKKAKVLYEYVSDGPGELTIRPGDIIFIIDDDPLESWWEGMIEGGNRGFFPAQYCEVLPDDGTRLAKKMERSARKSKYVTKKKKRGESSNSLSVDGEKKERKAKREPSSGSTKHKVRKSTVSSNDAAEAEIASLKSEITRLKSEKEIVVPPSVLIPKVSESEKAMATEKDEWKRKAEEALAEVAQLQAQLAAKDAELSELSQSNQSSSAKVDELTKELDDSQRSLQQAQSELAEERSKPAPNSTDHSADERVQALEGQVQTLKAEVSTLKGQLHEASLRASEAQKTIQQLKSQPAVPKMPPKQPLQPGSIKREGSRPLPPPPGQGKAPPMLPTRQSAGRPVSPVPATSEAPPLPTRQSLPPQQPQPAGPPALAVPGGLKKAGIPARPASQKFAASPKKAPPPSLLPRPNSVSNLKTPAYIPAASAASVSMPREPSSPEVGGVNGISEEFINRRQFFEALKKK